MNPPSVRNPRPRVVAGALNSLQAHRSQPFKRCTGLLASGRLDAELAHILEAVFYQRTDVCLRDVAFGAEMSPRRHIGEHLAIARHEVGHADHRRARTLSEFA